MIPSSAKREEEALLKWLSRIIGDCVESGYIFVIFCPQTKFWLNFSPREILSGYNIVKWVSHIIGDCVEGGGVIHLVAHAVGGNVILPKSV